MNGMKMKRLLSTLCVAMAASWALCAYGRDDSEYVTVDYDLKGFTCIDVSSAVDVKVSLSDAYSVKIDVPKKLMDYLVVRVSGRELKVSLPNMPARLNRRFNNWDITVRVSMPVLEGLEMSGATTFSCADRIDLGGGKFDLEMSGASKLGGLKLENGDLDMEISGASKAEIDGSVRRAELELSGASSLTITGSAQVADMEVSGASVLRSLDFEAGDVEVEVSGASKAEVSASRSISIEVSGASTFSWRGPESLEMRKLSVSRASNAKRL